MPDNPEHHESRGDESGDELLSVSELARDYREHPPRPTWEWKDNHLVHIATDYSIDVRRIDTFEKICDWVCHLTEKTWVDREVIGEFVMMAGERLGLRRGIA